MRGSIGKPGAGVCPVRGHSNVQGDRTMGIWERPKKEFLDKLQEVFGFDPPRKFGYDTVEAIRAMHAGQAKVFFALGGNFLSATPDTEFTAAALRRCALTVQVSTKLNRGHLVTGRQAVILPCLGRSERDLQASGPQLVSCENSMGVVQSSQGNQEPASEHLLSEPAIVARLALATLRDRGGVPWQQLIERLRPHPRPDCAGGSRIRPIQRASPQARRVLSAQRSPAKDASRPNRERRTSRSIPCRKIIWSRASW